MDLETLLQLEFCCWMQQAHCGPLQSQNKTSDPCVQFDNRKRQLNIGLGGLRWLLQLPSGYRSEADATGRWKRFESCSATDDSQAFRVRILGPSGTVMSGKETVSNTEICEMLNEKQMQDALDWGIDLYWAEPMLREDLVRDAAICEILIQSAGTLFDVLDAMASFSEQYVRFADEKDAMLWRYLRDNVETAVSRCKISKETLDEVAKAAATILSCLLLRAENCEALAAKIKEVSFGYGSSDESTSSSKEVASYGKLEIDSGITTNTWKVIAAAVDETKVDKLILIHTGEDHALANEYQQRQMEGQNVTIPSKRRKLSDAADHMISNEEWSQTSSLDCLSVSEPIQETDLNKYLHLSDEFSDPWEDEDEMASWIATSTLCKMAKVKAIRDGKVLHWCNLRASWHNDLTIDISLDLPSFMDHDLIAVASTIGLNKDHALSININFQKHSSKQSISLIEPTVIVSQPDCIGLSSSFAMSYLLPHIVRQYLEQQLTPSLIVSQKNCFIGLLRHVIKYLACLTSICVFCGNQLEYVPTDNPRACNLTICQARLLCWGPAASSPQPEKIARELGPEKIARELELSYWDYYDSDDCMDDDQAYDNSLVFDKSDDSIGEDEARRDMTDNEAYNDMEADRTGHASTCSALRRIVADAKLILRAG